MPTVLNPFEISAALARQRLGELAEIEHERAQHDRHHQIPDWVMYFHCLDRWMRQGRTPPKAWSPHQRLRARWRRWKHHRQHLRRSGASGGWSVSGRAGPRGGRR